jgi:nucleoside-diphosphate-sugar epimerase
MNILVTGGSGFIASHIVTTLLSAGHAVTCCVRNVSYAKNLLPQAKIIPCHFTKDNHTDDWVPRLKDIDVVINCVGILYHPIKDNIWKIHYETPRALFDACVETSVQKIIQISALGVDSVAVDYAESKLKADNYLQTLPIASVILRPSLVYGKGSYGGTSLFRGLAALPGIIPVPGKGEQCFQPIHLDDLTKAILRLIDIPLEKSMILHAVGPEQLPLKAILPKIRSWLGLPKAVLLFIPMIFIRLGSWFGNLMPDSSLNNTSYKMMLHNNMTTPEETQRFHAYIGFTPRNFDTGLYSQPSSVQDHWHAKLYCLKPALQFSLAFLWIFSGITGLWLYPKTSTFYLLGQAGIATALQPLFLYGSCLIDLLLGMALLCGFQLKKTCILQIAIIIGYTLFLTVTMPYLWFELFAPIAKNIPILAATFILLAIASDR